MPDGPQHSYFNNEYGFFNAEGARALYQTYRSKNVYRYNSGLLQAGVAAGKTDANGGVTRSRILRTQSPTGLRFFIWVVERVGKKPLLPHPESLDKNETLNDATINVYDPEIDATAKTITYRVEGEYIYLLLEPRLHLNTLRMGVGPHLNLSADQMTYGPNDFVTKLQ